jgi:hypothetical protein
MAEIVRRHVAAVHIGSFLRRGNPDPRLSLVGHKQTSQHIRSMSALPPKADIETGPVINFDATTPAASRHWRRSFSPRLW